MWKKNDEGEWESPNITVINNFLIKGLEDIFGF